MIPIREVLAIFFQIFTAGMAISGAYSFFLRNIFTKKKEDLYIFLIFVALSLYSALTVVGQITYMKYGPISILDTIFKTNALVLLLGSIFIVYFLFEKFEIKKNWLFNVFMTLATLEAYLLLTSNFNLKSPAEYLTFVLAPDFVSTIPFLVTYNISAIPPEIFWVIAWLILGFKYLITARKSKLQGEKNILNLSGVAALMVFAAVGFLFASGNVKDPNYFFVFAWSLFLLSSIGFFWGNIIQPKEEVARFPLQYFKTRILYKLLFIFILLIVLLLEVTTIATIKLNQTHQQSAIKRNFEITARIIADKIEGADNSINYSDKSGTSYVAYLGVKIDEKLVQTHIEQEIAYQNKIDNKRAANLNVFVVDKNGRFVIGRPTNTPGPGKNIKLIDTAPINFPNQDLSDIPAVQQVMKGRSGAIEYATDEFSTDAKDKQRLGAYSPIKRFGLGVIVEAPQWDAYADIRQVNSTTLILAIFGIFITVIIGIFFAKSIEHSLKQILVGTEAVKKNDLNYKIKITSMDEIGQLAQAFNQMTKELKMSQENLVASEKLASLGTMAAGIAHEIKNGLTSLRTFTQLFPTRYQDEEFRTKFMTIVPAEIDKINKIIESLLRFGRPHKPEVTQVNVNEILEEIVSIYDNEARKHNIRVTTKFTEIPKVLGDGGQLSQAFVNLIINAIQAMPNGGELTIKTDKGEKTIFKTSAVEGSGEDQAVPQPVIFIEISDTGVGIPDDNQKRIFDPFFTTKEVGGTGMGLPITHRIIEDHHGTLRLKSKMGQGTTFFIDLPQGVEPGTGRQYYNQSE